MILALFWQSDLGPNNNNNDYPKLVNWLNSITTCPLDISLEFYAVPGNFRMAQSTAYKTGRIYGQDVSSGAAVAVLMDPPPSLDITTHSTERTKQEGDAALKNDPALIRILDLCCAPGLKLCAIADWLERNSEETTTVPSILVGVDISTSRLNVAKSVIQKYHIQPETRGDKIPKLGTESSRPRIQLYHGDGTTFGEQPNSSQHVLVFDSRVAQVDEEEQLQSGSKRKRKNKSSRARERKRLQRLQEQEGGLEMVEPTGPVLFDRVLVDAECSTDGSLKHVQKMLQDEEGKKTGGILPFLSDQQKAEELLDLQKRLAFRGFALLRRGGYMVYSTCSLSEKQNEGIVSQLLKDHSDAVLVPISIAKLGSSQWVVQGSIHGTVRFLPSAAGDECYGGGFFLAKIQKT